LAFSLRGIPLTSSRRRLSRTWLAARQTHTDKIPSVICVGEVLWDCFPEGLFLGGAPTNVATHSAALGRPAAVVSCVGDDELGRQALHRLKQRDVECFISSHDSLPTGTVRVEVDHRGIPSYDIIKPVAWDDVAVDEGVMARLSASPPDVCLYGSLASRSAKTRQTTYRIADTAKRRCFDVNLRPPYDSRVVVQEALEKTDWLVKLSVEEWKTVSEWFDIPHSLPEGARQLSEKFGIESVCITFGEHGSGMFRKGQWKEHRGYDVSPWLEDTVGAGDAFLATLVDRLLTLEDTNPLLFTNDSRVEHILGEANLVAAYVATKRGATPMVTREALEGFREGVRANGQSAEDDFMLPGVRYVV